jgi:hypothetical protein
MKYLTSSIALVVASTAALSFAADEVSWPPKLPGGKSFVTIQSPQLLKPAGDLQDGVTIAKTPPKVEFHYYDCQTYEGKPWSVWGDGLAIGDKYYSPVGDHLSPMGNAYVYEYDAKSKALKKIVDVRQVLKKPDGWYTPGKIHSQLGLGKDGCLYFSTHRGSTRVGLNPVNHFEGDWILRCNPETGKTEVVVHAPLKMQCLPTGSLDGERMIWYAGSADGLNQGEPQFLAYDVENGKTLYADDHGPYRAIILAKSTGKMYFHGEKSSPGNKGEGANLYRFDPEKPGKPQKIDAVVGLRAASGETPQGIVYTIDHDNLWAFDVKTEKAKHLGPTAVASKTYTTSLDTDPTGRYIYYIPGAHGGAENDGTPVVQYDTKTNKRKVICFLHPTLEKETGYIPIGSFGYALSPDGGKLYVTWNGAHDVAENARKVPFRSVAMTVIEIPASERVTE